MTHKKETLEIILDSATRVFAASGFAGARMDEIARQAGVNKATIYYNVGNKAALYEAVLLSVFKAPLQAVKQQMQTTPDPEEQLRLYVRAIARTFDANPLIPKIFMWEHASGGDSFPEAVAGQIARILEVITDILERGEKSGVFRPVTPMLLQFMVVASLMFYKTSAPIRTRFEAFPDAAKRLPLQLTGSVSDEFEQLILNAVRTDREGA